MPRFEFAKIDIAERQPMQRLFAAQQLGDEPGDAIVYPSTTLHEVRPVTAGQRLVSITFIESVIADQHQRQVERRQRDLEALQQRDEFGHLNATRAALRADPWAAVS